MLESLAGISVICTYLLTNPAAGEAHVGYAFRLLRIRNCEGVRPQDLPASQTHAYDYVREGIGNVYYALARVRRAQGETDAALAAFETSLAVREPLPSLSARKGVAATLHSLAGLLNAIGRDGEAKVLIERAISRKEAIYGTEPNEEVSASLHNLASILIKRCAAAPAALLNWWRGMLSIAKRRRSSGSVSKSAPIIISTVSSLE
jgi:tetratricopeptide (TPR) repeat protein